MATGANLAGLGLGPLLAGLLAGVTPWPLRLPYGAFLAILGLAAVATAMAEETVKHPKPVRQVSLRQRLGVPREIRGQFISPAVTTFVVFALVGFYAALTPSLLGETLHEIDPAAGGAVVGELFFVATATVVVLRRLESRTAMLGGVGLPIPSLALLVMVQSLRSMPVLVVGTALGGAAACALGYRGSLQVINRIAPADRRAEVVSSYLVAGNVGIAIPIIGIGLTKQLASATTADLGFAIVIALFAILALLTGLKYAPER